VFDAASQRSLPSDRAAVARTVRHLVLAVVQGQTPTGVSIVIEGAPGIGKTFLVRDILASVAPGAAKILHVAGEQARRNEPFAAVGQLLAGQLLAGLPAGRDPGEAAFDHVDELCADGPVVLCADDAHYLDAASLTLLRRLAWASQSLPLALLINTRPSPAREQLRLLIRQARLRLLLPPMSRMMVERLVFDRTGRWPGPLLRRILGLAAGNPLFAGELLRAYEHADALAAAGPDTIEAKFELDVRGTGLDEVIRAQLRQLDEPTLDVLAAVAVWGTDIGAGDLAAMLFSPADGLDELIERAISSGLIRREPAGTIGFAHDLFREVTYAELPDPRRRAAHRRAAQVLTAAGYSP
jgi:predicted ATPase